MRDHDELEASRESAATHVPQTWRGGSTAALPMKVTTRTGEAGMRITQRDEQRANEEQES
jgi:hypothetical protein